MKKRKLFSTIILLAISGIIVCGCHNTDDAEDLQPPDTSGSSYDMTVGEVVNMPEDFIMGMDASCVPALEDGGVRYYDMDGTEKDVYAILSENGINYIRVRIWNDPFDSEGHGYGGGNCDIHNAVEIGKRATAQGMKLLVNFHYSDFWADPGKQMVPKAWQEMDLAEKAQALYQYTKESLKKLLDAGVDIGMIQVGNETNGSMCGETDWANIARLMSEGSRAVRECCPDALVVLHFANPESKSRYAEYGRMLKQYEVDYDVFASSYYPFWHGTLENLSSVLTDIAVTYGKKVMVAETSYAYTSEDTDFYGNTVGEGSAAPGYPISTEGQMKLVRDVVDTVVNKTQNGIGVFYWEGTWIAAGGKNYEENRALWEKYGSGWASSYAVEYDPNDAGKWYGGCSVDNQAFFDKNGKATEALRVFSILRGETDTNK